MKRFFLIIAVLGLVASCSNTDNPGNDDNHGDPSGKTEATAIKLNKHSLLLDRGADELLSVFFTPSGVSDMSLEWTSSDKSVADVIDGMVIAAGAGSAEITVSHGGLTDKCTVTVFVPAEGIVLNESSFTFFDLNQTLDLTATVYPADTQDEIEWKSSKSTVATVSDGKVTPVAFGNADIIVTCGSASAKCAVRVVATAIPATSVSLNKDNVELKVGEIVALTAEALPSDTTDKLVFSSTPEGIVTVEHGFITALAPGNAVITATAGSQSATCQVVVAPFSFAPVDLGLSVKWANANLEASSFEDTGGFYAWGELATKPSYTRFIYEYYVWNSSVIPDISKYNSDDHKLTLDPEDDAATHLLGGNWHIPTEAEFKELITECTWSWDYIRNGLLVFGPNGNSIFIPRAGYCAGSDYYPYKVRYWTSTLNDHSPEEAMCYFSYLTWSDEVENIIKSTFRLLGLPIRPVTK